MPDNIVNILKTLGDNTRLRIVHLIDQCGPDLCVCDMVAVLNLPQSTISRQLMRLRHTGIVDDFRDGMWINYSIRNSGNETVDRLLQALRETWDDNYTFKADKKKFYQLHAKNEIVRCKRGANLAVPELSR